LDSDLARAVLDVREYFSPTLPAAGPPSPDAQFGDDLQAALSRWQELYGAWSADPAGTEPGAIVAAYAAVTEASTETGTAPDAPIAPEGTTGATEASTAVPDTSTTPPDDGGNAA
jgi:hypothetical protein